MLSKTSVLCPLILACLLANSILAQPEASFDEVGRFYLQSFGPEEYQGHHQNWAIVQNARGLIYFGNGAGVLEFDGISWRLIPTANQSVVRSLAIDARDRIFVGAIGEIGYLEADSSGQLNFEFQPRLVRNQVTGVDDVFSVDCFFQETTVGTIKYRSRPAYAELE